MAAFYRKLMDWAYLVCVVLAGMALVLISAVIPWAVYTRYVLNSAASWPEPTAVLLTIVLTFFGAAACYRLGLHMRVTVGVDLLPARARRIIDLIVEMLMAIMAVFMIVYGYRLCVATWDNTIAEFPALRVGVVYSPIPFGGAFTLLFIIEHLWLGRPEGGRRRRPFSRGVRVGRAMDLLDSARHAVPLLRHRHADLLFARLRRARRRLVDRHPARGGDAEDLRRRLQGGDAHHSVLRARRRHHGGRRHGTAAGQVRQCHRWLVRVRGGLSAVNILATTFLSGISGSSVADTSAIGSVMIPQMEKVGYPRVFATNVTISASLQAILVPPSHNAVIYSLATGGTISIISLFMAGVVPGLLLGLALVMLCLFMAYRDGHPKGDSVPLREAVKITIDATWGLITIVIIIGGILLGMFTAIEAGAMACVWAFCVTMFIYRDYRWRDLPALVHRTLKTVAMVMTLIAMASSFGYVMALMQCRPRSRRSFSRCRITNTSS